MIELHYYPGNASLAPHMVLEEIGAPYGLRLVDRDRQMHKSPAYLALNPNGLIPVLHDGDLVLYESAAICLHLADTHPAAGLLPPLGSAARAHAYKWLAWLTNTLQSTLLAYFYPERWAADADAIAQVKAHAEARVGTLLDQLEAELARRDGPWLLGEAYAVVDPYALMLCRWTRGFGRPARDLRRLGAYLQRVIARPAVQRAIEQEGLTGAFV
ncbi:glutathione S-transferase family protein [Piscinibacter koreensis]|uniref:Glutathione S-transferase family protein n=1 Tax=Piscinibacter koreensis TaxID=2742824 RepID=A0A7Y6NJB4_9BURK|nr:glutathione S-transferase family protein [Schlegelella koreensis]NUZ04212.1 glutathione S-transferase family protein [Schlegelella koreensis]